MEKAGNDLKTCNLCILNENFPGIDFDEHGICSFCREKRSYKPLGEDKLHALLKEAKDKNREYDVLVPLSGGKDSTYILHLAVHEYKLKVLTMTYDNGFFSQIALDNIKRAVEVANVKHIFCRPDPVLQKKISRTMLLSSGDFCGCCDIGTKMNILKVAQDNNVALILYGNSPLENDSFVPDSIQDISRFKYILKESKEFTNKEINDFLIYPNLNMFRLSYYKKTGKFPKELSPLFYFENPSDTEVGEIIAREMNWVEDTSREYSKHFDCFAEPFSNFLRHKIYGYERRICQYSNMVRKNEVTRQKAFDLYLADRIEIKPENYNKVLQHLNIPADKLDDLINIPPLKYEKYISVMNRIFTKMMKIRQSIR